MARITLRVDDQVITLYTGRGLSAYESYLRTTNDNPPLTESEWASAFAEAKQYGEDIDDLKARVQEIESRAVFVNTTHW